MTSRLATPSSLRTHLPRAVVAATGLGILVVAGTGLFAKVAGISPEMLTREPQVALDGPFYVGALSNLGAIVWSVPAVACLLASALTTGRVRRALLAAGALSAFLLADDLFLLHDAVFPRVGVSESMVQAAYLLAIVLIAVLFRDELGLFVIGGMALTLGWWAVSVGMDTLLNNHPLNGEQLVEDGAKFVGIVVWAATWATYSYLTLREQTGLSADPS